MTDQPKTEPDIEPPDLGTSGRRIDTEVGRLARAGAQLHDGHLRARDMAKDTGLRREIQHLSAANPEGDGPFRQHLGADLLPAAPASERAEVASITVPGHPPPPAGHPPVPPGAAPLPTPEPKGPDAPERGASPAKAAPSTRDPAAADEREPNITDLPGWDIGVKSNTVLERNAHALRIPQKALLEGRAGEKRLRELEATEAAAKKRRRIVLAVAVVGAIGVLAALSASGVFSTYNIRVQKAPSAMATGSAGAPPEPATSGVVAAPMVMPVAASSVVVEPVATATPAASASVEPAASPSSATPVASSKKPPVRVPPSAQAPKAPPDGPPKGDGPLTGKPQF